MKRKVIDKLIEWKDQKNGIPLLLTGAKGVGKTYLAYDFAKSFFEHICYINFEREPKTADLFQSNHLTTIQTQLSLYFNINPEEPPETRILILDEIRFCKEAVSFLNQLDFSQTFRFVLCITSSPLTAYPLNQAVHVPVYPLDFDEFLLATSNDWYVEAITTHYSTDRKIPDIVHKELLALHELYLQIGGMPGIINEYLSLSSTVNVSEQHSFLISSYHDYILKENPDSDALKMNQVFDSLPSQLMKENKKFQYKLIRKGTTYSMYKEAIQRLSNHNYIIKCSRIGSSQLSDAVRMLKCEEWQNDEANTSFKLYLPDTGMLHSKIAAEYGISPFQNNSKALLENYVAQSLLAQNYPFAFWESDSMAKIDFIYLKDNDLYPIEIFDSNNTRSKSISILKHKCKFPYAIKISSKNFEFSKQVKYVPYYAVFCL